MSNANAILLGKRYNRRCIVAVSGSGEVSDRFIRMNSTGAAQIHADGTGPLVLSNVLNDAVAGNKTLNLRGSNPAANMITGTLTNYTGNLAQALSVTHDGAATWVLPVTTLTRYNHCFGWCSGYRVVNRLRNRPSPHAKRFLAAYGGNQTINNFTTFVDNTTSGFMGDYSIDFLQDVTIGHTTNDLGINNNVADTGVVTFQQNLIASTLAEDQTFNIQGHGTTVINGNISAPSGDTLTLTYTGQGNGILQLNGTGTDLGAGNININGGTLRLGAADVIPNGITGTSTVSGNVSNLNVINIASTSGLSVNDLVRGTGVTGVRIQSIDSATQLTLTGNISTTSGNTLTFGQRAGNIVMNPVATNTATLDLNGFSETINGLSNGSGNGSVFINNSSATAATLTFGDNNQAVSLGAVNTGNVTISNTGGGALSLAKIGNATANITGTLTYTGSTSANGGVMNINSTTATTAVSGNAGSLYLKGGLTTPSTLTSVTTDNGGLVSFASGLGQAMDNLTSLNLSLNANSGLELDVGDSGTDKLTTTSASVANITTLFIKDIDLSPSTTYDLIAAPGGLGVLGNYNLNLPGYSGSSLTVTPTLVQLNVGTLITGDVYWNNGTGATTGNGTGTLTQSWATVDPTTFNTNFSGNVGGDVYLQTSSNLPGKGQIVIFQADTVTGGGNLSTTLDQSFSVNALEFRPSTVLADTSRAITIAPGTVATNSLTVRPSLTTDGVKLLAGGPGTVSITAPFVAGTAQTWTVGELPVSTTVTTSNGSNLVTVGNTAGLTPGMAVSGAGIPAGATILSIGNATTFTISGNATASGNAANFFATQQLNMSGALSGAGPISKDGQGRVVLSGPNTTTYAGNYTNLNGFTQLATLTGLGATSAVGSGADITITGGTFYYGNTTAGNVVHDLTLNGGTLSAGGNSHTYSGNVNVAAASSINMRDSGLTTAETTGRNITLSGLVSGNASLTVDSVTTVSGGNQLANNLVFNNAANTWNGPLVMNRGSVFFQNIAGSGNATPYFAFTGNIDFNQFGRVTYREVDGATLTRLAPINFAGNAVGELSIDNTNGTPLANYTVNQNGAVNLNEGSIARFTLDAGSALNLNGGVVLNGNASLSTQGGTGATNLLTISGISGNGSIAFNDEVGVGGNWGVTSRTINITGASTFTGNSSLNEGTLGLGHKDALNGTGTFTVTGNSTLLALSDLSGANAINNPTTVNATLTIGGTNNLELSNSVSGNGAITVTNSNVTTLSGSNSYSGLTTMNAAAGTLRFSGSNSSAGNTTLTAGKLEFDNASNGGLASGLLTISGGTVEALNAARTLSNAVTLSGNLAVVGSQDLTFNGNVTQTGGSRTITNNTTAGNVRYDNLALSGNATAYNLTLAGAGNTVIGNLANTFANNTLTNNQSSLVTIDSNVFLSESAVGTHAHFGW